MNIKPRLFLCDIRNNSSFYKLAAVLYLNEINNNEKILLVTKANENISNFKKLHHNYDILEYKKSIEDFHLLFEIIKGKFKYFEINFSNYFIKNKIENYKEIIFISGFNKGFFYYFFLNLIKKRIKVQKIYSFDDGYESINQNNYTRKLTFKSLFKNYLFKIFLGNSINVDLSDTENISKYYSSFKKYETIKAYKKVINYNFELLSVYKKFYYSSENEILKKYNSKYFFLSHHAVESNRMSQSSYHSLVKKVIKSLNLKKDDLLVISKHHAETSINEKFYQSLHKNLLFTENPAELVIINNNFNVIVAPFNSTLIQLDSMDINLNFKKFIGYIIPKSPNIKNRVDLTKKILSKYSIKLDIYE